MYVAEMSNMTDLWLYQVCFSSSKYPKTRFHALHIPSPGVSVVNPPQHKFLATHTHDVTHLTVIEPIFDLSKPNRGLGFSGFMQSQLSLSLCT